MIRPRRELTLQDYAAMKCALNVTCRRCRHKATLFMPDLIERFGARAVLADVRAKLLCRECGYDAADCEPMMC